jgi:hypothetical protein
MEALSMFRSELAKENYKHDRSKASCVIIAHKDHVLD